MNFTRMNQLLLGGLVIASFAAIGMSIQDKAEQGEFLGNATTQTAPATFLANKDEHDDHGGDHDGDHLSPVLLMVDESPAQAANKDEHEDEHGDEHLSPTAQNSDDHDDKDKDHH